MPLPLGANRRSCQQRYRQPREYNGRRRNLAHRICYLVRYPPGFLAFHPTPRKRQRSPPRETEGVGSNVQALAKPGEACNL